MVSDALSLVLGVGSFLGLVALGIWQHHSRLESKYSDDYYELEDYRWSEFSSDLGELLAGINQLTEFDPEDGEHDVPPQSQIVTVIDNEVDRSQMADIEDALRDFDEIRELKDEAKSDYKTSYRLFGITCLLTFAIGAGLAIFQAPENLLVIIASVAAYTFFIAILNIRTGYGYENELDDLIDEYKSPAT